MKRIRQTGAILLTMLLLVAYIPTADAAALRITNVSSEQKVMYVGSSFLLQTIGKKVAYASSKAKVASVDSSGRITAKKAGTAKITAMDASGNVASIKVTVKKAAGYTISKKSGTYTDQVTVTLKAKSGYVCYYTTGKSFSKKKKVASNKKVTLTVSKTTTLQVFAVKKNSKLTVKQCNRASVRKKNAGYQQYYYLIQTTEEADTSSTEAATTQSAAATTQEASKDNNTSSSGDSQPAPPDQNTSGDGRPTPPDWDASGDSRPTPPDQNASGDGQPTPPGGNTTTGEAITGEEEQETLNQAVKTAALSGSSDTTEKKEITLSGAEQTIDLAGVSASDTIDGISVEAGENATVVTVTDAGTYVVTGGTKENPIENVVLQVKKGISDEVTLVCKDLYLDDSALDAVDGYSSVIEIGNTEQVTIALSGENEITGIGTTDAASAVPTAVIAATNKATTLVMTAVEGEENASLTVTDSIAASTDFGDKDPADGIFAKGSLSVQGGQYTIQVNGDCLKGTGADGTGGVYLSGGTGKLTSYLSNGIKSKNGNLVVTGGTWNTEYTKGDGLQAKNYGVTITGGTVTIAQCYGDGIQGETVTITDGDISITTCYENAGVNYYSSKTSNYNTLSKTQSASGETKTEVVATDTGSHKGIKAGTKACTKTYATDTTGSSETQEASGGLTITGGTITIDTTQTGIKYNSGNQSGKNSGADTTVACDGQVILGSPDDAIHSNYWAVITGGTLILSSADDGITSAGALYLANGCNVTVKEAYEGIEGGDIIIGSSEGETKTPVISVSTYDDGINAASKASVSYVYTDETEEAYTKTEVAATDNTLTILDGKVTVKIADDSTHSVTLPVEGQSDVTVSFAADGDGIDCNGSFYALGGTIVVYGPVSDDNSAIDTDATYQIGAGVTLLAVGSSGMVENPNSISQAVITYGSSGMNGSRPGRPGSSSSSSTSSSEAFSILDADGNVLQTVDPGKAYSYILYSSPELTEGATYSFTRGGTTFAQVTASTSIN